MATPRKTPRKGVPFDAEKECRRASSVPGEEGIQVAIRMRPMNNKESEGRRVWRVLQKFNSITQTTPDGKPLPDRANGRTFFTFDKTFGEDSTTTQIYSDVASKIVNSAVSGLNGTIFAYGQTSSGKTFTMLGGGLKQPDVHGIIQMAGKDIFTQIALNPSRVFLLRVSFIEIYNEEVRDLLVSGAAQGSGAVLAIREDPRHGVFVNANETFVTDLETLLSVMYAGEKNRAVGSTAMNERSSRSHTIFRITLESRKRKETLDEDEDNSDFEDENKSQRPNLQDDDDDGAVRVSTLNLVDLAGSESVRHTGATGERQKEGGRINQSLLTLSRVIAALGQPGSTHINFRDSKLTRILQPSLSGNAHMAVICCATPSELYLEETRSTLQFASRAKLVKTKPKVNEVLDDSSLIKRLQRELAEARKLAEGRENQQQIQNLQAEAQNAAREAEAKLRRVKACFLKGGILPTALFGDYSKRESDAKAPIEVFEHEHKKRRRSDGSTGLSVMPPAMQTTPENSKIRTTQAFSSSHVYNDSICRKEKINFAVPSMEAELLRDALYAKGQKHLGLKNEMSVLLNKLEKAKQELATAYDQNLTLQSINEAIEAKAKSLTADKEFMQAEFENIINEQKETQKKSELYFESVVTEKDIQFERIMEENKCMKEKIEAIELKLMQSTASAEENRQSALKISYELDQTKSENSALLEEVSDHIAAKDSILMKNIELNEIISQLELQLKYSKEEKENMKQQLDDLETANRYENEAIKLKLIQATAFAEESTQRALKIADALAQSKSENLALLEEVNHLKAVHESVSVKSNLDIKQLEEQNIKLCETNAQLDYQLKCSKEEKDLVRQQLMELEAETETIKLKLIQAASSAEENGQRTLEIGDKLAQTISENACLLKEISDHKAAEDSILTKNIELNEVICQLEYQLKYSKEENERMKVQLEELVVANKDKIEAVELKLVQTAASAEENRRSALQIGDELSRTKSENSALVKEINDLKVAKDSISSQSAHVMKQLEVEINKLKETNSQLDYQLECSQEEFEVTKQQLEDLKAASKNEIEASRQSTLRVGDELARTKSENASLLKEISELMASKEYILAVKEELNEKNSLLEYQLKCSQEENVITKQQLEELKATSYDEIEVSRQGALKVSDELARTKSENASLFKEISDLVAAKDSILAVKNELSEANSLLEQNLKHAQEEIEIFRQRFIELEAASKDEIEAITLKLSQAAAYAEENTRSVLKMGDELAQTKSENASLFKEISDLRAAKDSFLTEKIELNESICQLEHDLKYAQEEKEAFKQQLEDLEAANKDEIEAITLKLIQAAASAEENRQSVLKISDELAQTKSENSALLEEISDLRASKDSFWTEKTELNELICQLEHHLKYAQEENESFKQRLRELESANKDEIEAINLKLIHATASAEENRQSALKMGDELAQTKSENASLLKEISELVATKDSISAVQNELYESNSILEQNLKYAQEENEIFKQRLTELEVANKDEIEAITLKLIQAAASAEENTKSVLKMGDELARTKSDNSSLLKEISDLMAAKDSISVAKSELNETNSILEQNLKHAQEENEIFKRRLTELEAINKEQSEAFTLKLIQSAASAEENTRSVLKISDELAQTKSENSALLEELRDLRASKDSFWTEKTELNELICQLEHHLKYAQEENESFKQRLRELEAANKDEIEAINLKLIHAIAFAEESRQSALNIDDELAQTKSENASLLKEISDLVASKDSISAMKNELNETNSLLEQNLKYAQEENEIFKQRLTELEAANKDEIEAITLKLIQAAASTEESRQSALKMGDELARTKSDNSSLLKEISDLVAAKDSISVAKNELNETNSILEQNLKHAQEENEIFKQRLTELEAINKEQSEAVTLKLIQAAASAEENNRSVLKISDELAQTKSENSTLLEELRDLRASKDSFWTEKTELNELICQLEHHLKYAQEENEIFKQRLMELEVANKDEIEAITLKLIQAAASAEENTQSVMKISDELAQTKSENSALIEEISDLRAAKDSFRTEKIELNEVISQLEHDLKYAKEENEAFKQRLEELEAANKDEIEAINSKLIQAAASAEESRQSALKICDELAQTKSENSALLEEINDLRVTSESVSLKLDHTIKQLEVDKRELTETNIQLEYQLKCSLEENRIFKQQLDDLKTANKDEIEAIKLNLTQAAASTEESAQRVLKMADELARTRTKNFALLEQINDLKANHESVSHKRDDAIKHLEAERVVLNEANCKLECQLKALSCELECLVKRNQEKDTSLQKIIERNEVCAASMRSEIDSLKQTISTIDSEKLNCQHEITALQDYVKLLKAQTHAAKQAASRESGNVICELKEKVMELEGELTNAKLEARTTEKHLEKINSLNEDLKQKYNAIEREARDLKIKCHQMETQLHSLANEYNMNKENQNNANLTASEAQQLQSEVSRLQEEIKSKDSRIKKLNAVKMTKEQCAALKRMKDERLLFMKQAKELGEKLETTEFELERLRSRLNEKQMSSSNSAETDIKEALGAKLRKYAAHVKQLDEERSLAFHAMKSAGTAFDEDDFVGSISSLCEKFVAMQEECDTMANIEGRATSYLLEAKQLRDTNEALKVKWKETESQLTEVLTVRDGLQLKLEQSSHAFASLQKERDELKLWFSAKESEKNRQISYLEKENLQLMHDLKESKKEAQHYRLEIEGIRLGGHQEATEDLKGLSLDLLAAKVFDKENINSGQSSKSVEVISKKNPLSQTPLSTIRIDAVSSKGKATASPPFRHSNVPTLGESTDEDATGECKQS